MALRLATKRAHLLADSSTQQERTATHTSSPNTRLPIRSAQVKQHVIFDAAAAALLDSVQLSQTRHERRGLPQVYQ